MKQTIILLACFIFLACSENSVETKINGDEYEINRAKSEGTNWKKVYELPKMDGVATVQCWDLTIDDQNRILVANTVFGVSRINHYDSTRIDLKNGLVSREVVNSFTTLASSVLCVDGKIIVGSTNLESLGGIYCSKDNGANFYSTKTWNQYAYISSLEKNPNGNIFAGCYQDLYYSIDNGESWNQITKIEGDSEQKYAYFYSFEFDKFGNIYAATRNGVYYADSKQFNFKQLALSGLTVLEIGITSQNEIFACTENAELYYQADKNSNWIRLDNYPKLQGRGIVINNNDVIFVGTSSGIYKSSNNGISWDLIALAGISVDELTVDLEGNILALTADNEIYISRF